MEYIGIAACGHTRAICSIVGRSRQDIARSVSDMVMQGLTVHAMPRLEALDAFEAGLDCHCRRPSEQQAMAL